MQIVIHRVNTIDQLREVPESFGIEIDIRGLYDKLVLSHDPIEEGRSYDELDPYLEHYKHALIVFNMKEAGYEQAVIDLARKHGAKDFFLLDVEFPYLYRATRKDGFRNIAVRYSEAEPIEAVLAQAEEEGPLLDWVWVDTNTRLPLNSTVVEQLFAFKTCLVCPERWGRPQDIGAYREEMERLKFVPDAVMTSLECVGQWVD